MIVFPEHALKRMEERGASRHEVRQAIRDGESSDARHGRTEFQYTSRTRRSGMALTTNTRDCRSMPRMMVGIGSS